VALKDFAIGLGFGFMESQERGKNQKRARRSVPSMSKSL